MKKLRTQTLLFAIILLLLAAGLFAQGKVTGYTTWDDTYFYAAFVVDDPNIVGTNSQPFSNPWEDDAVEIFLETDNNHQAGRSKNTYHMAVSAAGGGAFTVFSSDGSWQKKNILSFKYAAQVDGSVNNPDDLDVGYTVEMALPWFELGMDKPPTPGAMMSFNVVVRMRGEVNRFISMSPKVLAEKDIHDASKWANIVFTGPVFGAATLTLDKIVSSRYIARKPLIDGQTRLNEYNKNTSFSLDLPIDMSQRPKNQFQKLLLTGYHYWYQGDPRRTAPSAEVRAQDGRSILTDHPVTSAGPWFSYDRVQWHKDELADIRRAGIDVILPVYRGDAKSRTAYSAKGLDCMVEALRELKAARRPYPVVGMFFDSSAMTLAYGKAPDLRDEEVKKTFYGMIRDFFLRVPEEFRVQVPVSDERAGRPCYIVYVDSIAGLSDVDKSAVAYVNERFARDFGAGIFWLGGTDFKPKALGLDGYCAAGAGLGFCYDDSAKVRIAGIGPGFDDGAAEGKSVSMRSRDAGDVYKADWSKALQKRPSWIMLDGWNDLSDGSDICGSREYGFTYVDMTAVQALKFRGLKDYESKFMRHSLPKSIEPGRFYQADVLVQNDGMKPWRAAEGYALGYRWYQGGRLVAESPIKRPIQSDVLPGCSSNLTLGVAALKEGGESLPEGDYDLHLEMVRMADGKWFSQLGSEAFPVPVRIAKSEGQVATYLSVDGPVMLKAGTDYKYSVSVRNDSSVSWKAGQAAVGCKLYKVSSYIHGGPADLDQEVQTAPVKVSLTKDVQPGEAADVDVTVNLKDVPVWKQSDDWSYQLRFDLFDGSKWISESGVGARNRIVDVLDSNYGVSIIAADVADSIDAGKTCDVKLVVKNTGSEPWTAAKHSVGYHWYYLDGIEAVWDGVRTPVKPEIKPGEPGIVVAKVTAPPYDGRYILSWDFCDGERWVSTSDNSRGIETLSSEVTVQNGKLVFADLSKLCDTVATSPDRNRPSGNFDGAGLSFPSEVMPPDAGTGKPNDIYPCGYLWKAQGKGLECSRRISFRYGGKAAGVKNAVTCAGQAITIPKGSYAAIHVLGAAVEANQEGQFGLQYQGAPEPVKVAMSSWAAEPAHGEDVAFAALHRHSAYGDDPGVKCCLYHYTIPVDASRPLTSIVLPKNDKMRVVAVTVEKA